MTSDVATTARPDPTAPPLTATDEAKPHQHRVAQYQGDTYVTALVTVTFRDVPIEVGRA